MTPSAGPTRTADRTSPPGWGQPSPAGTRGGRPGLRVRRAVLRRAQELAGKAHPESLIPLVLASENQAELALAQGRTEDAWPAYRAALVRLTPEFERLPRAHGPLMVRLVQAAKGVRERLGQGPDPLLPEQILFPRVAQGARPLVGSVPGPAFAI